MLQTANLKEQVKIVKDSSLIQGVRYKTAYLDMAASGLPPSVHYLRFGAVTGRSRRTSFDTRYYLETYSDAAKSGPNPLVHYILSGRKERYLALNPKGAIQGATGRVIRNIRQKLLNLDLTCRLQADLKGLQACGETPLIGTAVHGLALWYMRDRTSKGCRTALEHIARAWADHPDPERRCRLVTLKLLRHPRLRQPGEARTLFERAGHERLADPDVLLLPRRQSGRRRTLRGAQIRGYGLLARICRTGWSDKPQDPDPVHAHGFPEILRRSGLWRVYPRDWRFPGLRRCHGPPIRPCHVEARGCLMADLMKGRAFPDHDGFAASLKPAMSRKQPAA